MEEFDKWMDKKFEKRLEGLGLSQQPPAVIRDDSPHIKRVNIKGSCSMVDPLGDDFGSTSQCELYVDCDSFTRFVALGKCYEEVTMLHNVHLRSNLIKVTMEKVLHGDAAIHVPTSKVTIVTKALHTFIA